ncbi:MAG TPA: tRNA lysidine(34) synthetase TilS [Candidatus Binatia bacterium]|nr:tRNA lysidine(34) synthetase TilS [Candidatus Binatia bacterium]
MREVESRLLRTVVRALRAPKAPAPGSHVLVAVSGGPDSTALLAALAALAPAHGLRVTAGHVDHGLRGAESAREAREVAALAARLGTAALVRRVTLAAGANLEARARRARYRALLAMAAEAGADVVATGHTADDQAETLLLRLVRGAGRRGLGGMRPRRGRLWRPLLEATRTDVRRFLADRGLPFAVDRTNADLSRTRNRIRRVLLPFMAADLNPRVVPALAALAARLRDEDALLETLAAARLAALRTREGRLRAEVAAEPAALARRVVRAWLEHGTRAGVAAVHVERVLALAAGRTRGAVAVPGPARVVREGDVLVRRRGRQATPEPFALPIAPGDVVVHPRGAWRLSLSPPRPRRPGEERAADAAHALFDADLVPGGLVVRSPMAGDRVRLLGGGTKKLQDVLVDAKVPRERRPGVPVLVADGDVLWVAGLVRGAGAAVGPGTRRVVEAAFERAE